MRTMYTVCILLFVPVGVFYAIYYLSSLPLVVEQQRVFSILPDEPAVTTKAYSLPSQSILFVGDVMLGRYVEYLMLQNGVSYPFVHLAPLFASSTYVVANFEAPVPKIHQPTPSGGFIFSVREAFLPTLRNAGVTHVSLANNHSLDQGKDGYLNTLLAFASSSIEAFGQANTVASSSVSYLTLDTMVVGVIGIHTLFASPYTSTLDALLLEMEDKSDLQIAFVHWGDEYELVHNDAQEKLATHLSLNGIDAIIGHHPHVTQDIDIINNVPVFYSLGNLIFDQYFSQDVQEGYTLALTPDSNELTFTLHPVTSVGTRSQTRSMSVAESSNFLEALALRSDPALASNIKQGKLIIEFDLAKR